MTGLMKGRVTLTPPRGLTLSLGVLTVLLIVAAAWPWLTFGRTTSHATAAAGATERVEAPALPVITAFSETVERPLFWPARRRLASGSPVAGATLLEQRYKLLGIVAIGDVRRAVLADMKGGDTSSHRTVELAEGGALDGWTLKRIDADSVIFDGPSGTTTLALGSAASSPAR